MRDERLPWALAAAPEPEVGERPDEVHEGQGRPHRPATAHLT
jgi:hypothetical protein